MASGGPQCVAMLHRFPPRFRKRTESCPTVKRGAAACRSARLFILRKLSTCERNHTRTLGRETGQMTQSPVPPGGAKETGKVDGPRPIDGDWRKALRCHADALWRGRPVDSNLTAELPRSLGPLAEDARTIVEAYALGARKGNGSADPPAEFGTRLD